MPNVNASDLNAATGLEVYETSIAKADAVTYFLGRKGLEKFVGSVGGGKIVGEKVGDIDGKAVVVGPTDHANAASIREAIPWTGPRCLGLATSVGLGDRLGLATPGHIHAFRGTGLKAILAQQSIREMTRTQRTADEVMDCATWGVLQEGFDEGFGADADHLQKPEEIDVTVAAGFKLFTIDPGAHVDNLVDNDDPAALGVKVAALLKKDLDCRAADMTARYIGTTLDLGTRKVTICDEMLLRAAAKYGHAVHHTVQMYRHLVEIAEGDFELEVSVDETESPTTPVEHYFFASELKRLGVKWVSMAPRFIGRFEKGVDYIGDLDEFRTSFAEHVAVMQRVGPYKMSIHSGSDKFSIYPLIADVAGEFVHVKTAGTSYLEAIRAIATIDAGLFREILDFAREHYEVDKATYHVSADASKVPPADSVADNDLADLLDQFDTRQALHVTFGSVLTDRAADGSTRFRDRILTSLKQDEATHYSVLSKHLGRHVAPFAK